MRKHWLILFIVMVVAVSGCTSPDSNSENQTKRFSGNNISFEYPSSWVTANSLANETVAAVGDPASVDSSGLAQVSVVIQSRELEGNLYDMYRDNYDTLFTNSSYRRVSETNTTIGGYQAIENVYLVLDGVQKKQRAIWIQNNRRVYVILCTAPADRFDAERKNFDLIVNSLRFI